MKFLKKVDISFIVVSYNYQDYIEECINSCLKQEYSDLTFEVIVINDGSTDNTKFILKKLNDIRLKKFTIKNSGVEIASNFGLKESSGKYIVRVDADDTLEPNFLSEIGKILKMNYDFYYSDYRIINEKSEFISNVYLPEFEVSEIFKRGDFLATGTIYRRNIIQEIGFYNIDQKNSGLENYELILKFLQLGFKGFHISKNLFNYRRHGKNISEKNKTKIIENGKRLFSRLGLGEYATNENHPYKLRI
jgi:glycosyltransferase involved in cell wall biosynthesis